jgi:hypothetical protein
VGPAVECHQPSRADQRGLDQALPGKSALVLPIAVPCNNVERELNEESSSHLEQQIEEPDIGYNS